MKPLLQNLGGRLRLAVAFAMIAGAAAQADEVLAWNDALLRSFAGHPEELDPHLEARAFALVHLAMADAMSAISREAPVGDRSAQVAAVDAAARTVVLATLPPATRNRVIGAREHTPSDRAVTGRWAERGRAIAQELLRRRESDNWIQLATPRARHGDGRALAVEQLLRDGPPRSPWLAARPFALRSAAQVEAPPLQWVTFDGQVELARGLSRAAVFDHVDREAAAASAGYWTSRPLVTWNAVARAVAESSGCDALARAEMLARLNVTLADAALAAGHWKFTYSSWQREMRGIVAGSDSPASREHAGVADAPLEIPRDGKLQVLLPPVRDFPAFPAVMAGAAEAVLRRVSAAGPVTVPVRASGGRAGARPFASATAAAREAAFAASLDGIHTRESCVSGYELGAGVGELVIRRWGRAAR